MTRSSWDFYRLLHEQAEKALEGLTALEAYVRTPLPAKGMEVRDLDKRVGDLKRIVADALERTPEPPMAREDISALAEAFVGMIEPARAVVDEMELFAVPTSDYLKQMTKVLREAGDGAAAAVLCLRNEPRACGEHLIRARKSANNVERVCREALTELLKSQNVPTVLKTREIYKHLSDSALRGSEAADIIGDILVKTA